jgi:tetratricopeptide (TPR) repeat protein
LKQPDDKKKKKLIYKKPNSKSQLQKEKVETGIANEFVSQKTKTTPKWFYAVLIILPIIFFILLEISLRIFNYGYNTQQWVDAGSNQYIINPEIAKRYFNNINYLPTTSEDVFDKQKKQNAFRVFILGGSSAAGYPYMPMGSFSRYIRRRLELTYPNTKIEVVNISMTAVNSYTVLDLISGVLEHDPNLILIYTGHNEFYGALGVGSLESLGSNRFIIKSVLYLNKFKTTQLVRNFISSVLSIFSSEKSKVKSGALMSRMAKDKSIKLNSEKFNNGIEQFSHNLADILSEVNEAKVPILIGRLASNIKDQKPFISVETPGFKTANEIFAQAKSALQNKKFSKADSLFNLAKDLDGLRFRAPEIFNTEIIKLCKKFKVHFVAIDSVFSSVSPDGITGNNLMVDHLHPNLAGYKLMGRTFYESMEKFGYLPKFEKPQIPFALQDSIANANFVFTELDSTISGMIVNMLKNDWPFVKNDEIVPKNKLLIPQNYIDSIAVDYIENRISWADAHVNAATYCLRKDKVKDYLNYMNAIVYQYPTLTDVPTAVKYFYNHKKINPSDYTTKRLGLIALYRKDYDTAINYLNESLNTTPNDPELLFELSMAYFEMQNYKLAKENLTKCQKLNPKYPGVFVLSNKLKGYK